MKKNYLIGLVTAVLLAFQGIAQNVTYDPSVFIDININSGNPNCPFPQFLEYPGGGKSLAKYNAEGVTHADMEKAMREAYEIMMHRCRYEGTYCGVKYISFNSDAVPGNYGTFVSEGDGYALLAAAIFADQKTFNGLYMWVHDIRFSGVERFRDGRTRGTNSNDYGGPYLAAWKDKTFDAPYGSDSHSATDGDVDIAMAMLIAYKQWGEWMMQDGQVVKDSRGNPISLKYEAQRVVGALVDTLGQWDKGSGQLTGMLCGVVGIDGYEKRGNSWGELTRWRFSNEANARYPGVNGPYNGGPNLMSIYGGNYIDYDAPSYFEEFWRWLKNGDGVDDKNRERSEWEIHQFKRAAASGNWLNKKAYDQGLYASIGRVEMATDGQPTFGVYVDGEDFRYPWRHILDYLWHGDADYDWDPVSHQVIAGTNNSERLMGVRHAGLLKNPSNSGTQICAKQGASPDPGQPQWFGVSQIPQQWTHTGGITSAYHTNYSVGAGATAAVASEDLELIADIYRQCELLWDDNSGSAKFTNPAQRYIGSTPKYFHGWFRTLGMLVCSGNMIAPEQMTPKANMKVYMSVDKTYAYEGDKVGYTVQYRNYGTVDATNVKIQTPLDEDYTFVSATKGGVYDPATHTITWNIGTVKGFKSGGLAATMDSVAFTVKITSLANNRVCETSTISGSNFPEWISNEYPNHATYTMERNCVDVLANRSLVVEKTANRTEFNPNDKVTFTVNFENVSSDDAWMNGGRDNVRISYGNYYMNGNAYQFYHLYRFWNDSYEAYINMSNYRVSYFMYDAAAQGLYNATTNPTGWTFVVDNQNDLDKYGYNPSTGPITFAYQKIPQGEDQYGKWNQRLMIRFADVLMAPSTHVYDKLDSQYLLHKGVWGPGFIRARLAANPAADLTTRVQDDWSFSTDITAGTIDGQGETFTLVSPCWANYDNLGYEIDNYARHVCSRPISKLTNFDRVLVEEFDGYTWRRIQGRGPLPGKEAYHVTIVDTIPKELRFDEFITKKALGIDATYTAAPANASYSGIVKWTIPEMLVGEKGKLVYTCIANDIGCPNAEDAHYVNAAWIYSDTDSPDSSSVDLMTTCTDLPPYIEPQTSLFKNASQETAVVGDVISYEVKYVNTTGTVVDENCSSTTNWMGLGGKSVPSSSGGALPLNTNGSSAYFFGPKYSYGENGSVYLTFSGCNSTTQELYFVMRYKSGTPGSGDFKGIAMKLRINIDGQHNFGYTLYNNGTKVAEDGTSWANALSFPGSSSNPVIKFVLNGDHLYLYINDAENEWTSVVKDWGNLVTGPGNFGLYVNSNGNGQTAIDNFRSELDYAYDITLSDELPNELGDIKNITGNGTYNSGTKKITWPMVAGPIAPNDGFSYTFDATVEECNSYINNYALASVYGQEQLKAVNSVKCGTTVCPDPPTVQSPVTYCKGESAIALTASGKKLKWYDADMELLPSAPVPSTDAAGSTTYYVTQTSGCESDPAEIVVVVNETEKPTVTATVSLCRNEKNVSPLSAGGENLKWYDELNVLLTDAPVPDVQTAGNTTYYVTQTVDDCESEPAEIEVTVGSLPTPTVVSPVELCFGDDAAPLTADADGTLQWYTVATDGTASTTAPTPSSTATEDTYYYVSQLSGSCESDRAAIKVVVKPKPIATISASSESYCGATSTVNLSLEMVDANLDMTGAEYAWKVGSDVVSTDETLNSAEAGTYVCEITLDGCSYTTEEVTVSQNDNPTYTITGGGSYCPESTEKTPVVITFTAGKAPFTFTDNVLGEVTSDSDVYTITNPEGGVYKLLSLKDDNGCEMVGTAAEVEVIDLPSPTLSIAPIASVCLGTASVDVSNSVTSSVTSFSYQTDKGTVSNAGVLTGLTEAGEYVVSVTATGADAPYCTTTETVTVTVLPLPTITMQDTYSVCSALDLTLKPEVDVETYTSVWEGSGATHLNSVQFNSPIFNTTETATKTYELTVTVTDGHSCSSQKGTTVTVYPLPTAELSATQNFVCQDDELPITATVSGNGTGTAEWDNVQMESLTTAKLVGSDNQPGEVTVTYVYTDEHSCVSKPAELKITVVETPATPTLPAISQCLNGDEKQLVATGIAEPRWYDADKNALAEAPTPKTNKEGTVNYYVSQVVDGCESALQELIVTTLNELEATIVLSNEGQTCVGTAVDVSLAQTFSSQVWSGSAASSLSSTTMANPTFLGTAAVDTYTLDVEVTDAAGCKGHASASIVVNPVPVVSLSTSKAANCISVTDAQIITATVTPNDLNGTFTWTNVTNESKLSAEFVPSTHAADDYDVTYQFTSEANCASNVATQKMTVNPLPVVTLTPSKTAICESGENSADITMSVSPSNTGVEYVISNNGTIASDGTFSASNNAVGTYTVKAIYTDGNDCVGESEEKQITINPLPEVSFVDAPATACYNATNVTLNVSPATSTASKFSFVGTSAAESSVFNPSTSAEGENTITYSFTDANGCQQSATHTIDVIKVLAPTIAAPNPRTVTIDNGVALDVNTMEAIPNVATDDIIWQLASGVVLGAGDGVNGAQFTSQASSEGIYTYFAKESRMIEGKACYSDSTKATLILSDCNAKSPIVENKNICVGDGTNNELTVELTASFAGATDGKKISWFAAGDDIENQTPMTDGDETTTWSATVSTADATTFTYYVSEYSESKDCWSYPTPVTITVNPLPIIEILPPAGYLCYADGTYSAKGTINGVPSTAGTWSVKDEDGKDEVAIDSRTGVIDVTSAGKVDGAYTVIYSYTDGFQCSNSAELEVSVEYPNIPLSNGYLGLVSKPLPVSVAVDENSLESDVLATDVKWYQSMTSQAEETTGTSWATGDDPAVEHVVTYYLTQTVHGCESEKGTALVQILACPFAKPVIANVNACENDATVQDFEAQLPTTTTVPAQSWIWYDAEKNELSSNNTNTFASNVSTAVNGTTQTTTFYVGYTATEPTTQETCPSPLTEVTVTVFALPVIEINDPAKSLCYADGDVQITARVNGAAASNGAWTVKNGEAEISAYGIFNTKQKGMVDGSYTVVYTYTDPTTNCTNSDELIVNVEYPEIPSAADKNLLKSEDDIILNAQGIENAENHIGTPNWYVLGVVDSDHSVDWKTPDDPTKVHSSQYYLSQTVNGCESEKYPVSVAVSSCPFKAPVAEQVNACQNAATVDDIVAALPTTTTVDATSWIWYDSDMNKLTGSTNNYSSEVSTAGAGSTKFYVSYTAIDPNTSLECESAPAEVYVVVRPLPELTFSASNKTLACYDGGDVAWTATVDFHTNGAGSGSWTLDGKENNGITQRGVINPAFFGEETGTHRVTYTYTDGAGCVDSVAEDITIQFTPAPVVTDFAALTEQNKTVVVTATPSSNDAEISWYDANNVKKSNNAEFETPDNGSVVTHKSYFATQTINTCESVKSEAKVDIIDCPVPKPIIVSPEAICNYDKVPELQASLGVWTSGSRPEGDAEVSFKYYESETGGEPIAVSTTGIYVPTIDVTTAATYNYWVSEYNGNVFPAACESKRAKVSLQVKKTEPPTIQASKTAVCYGNDNPSYSAIGQGIVRWHEEEPAYPAESYLSQGNPFVPSFDEVGVHTVWVTQVVDGCESEAVSKDFEILAIPEPPVVESATICEDGVSDTLKATPVENATILWYANEEKTSIASKNAKFVPQNQFAGEYKYFATQTVKGCMSDTVSATYTILPLPTIPVVQTEATACDYDGTHELSVAEQDGISVAWYATTDTTSLLGVGNTFTHEITKSGTVKYYVRQIENGCVGNYVMAHFNVIPQPQTPNATGDVICEGFEASIYTDGSKDKWYADEELTDMIGQGYALTLSEVAQTHTYYVVRENNGCVSETAEATIEVIPQPSVVIMQDGEEVSQIRRCSYDADGVISATVSPKPAADDYIEWFIFPGNIKVKDTDSLMLSEYVNLSSSVTSSNSYTIRAQYSVKNTYKNMYCVSDMDTVKYTTFAKVRQPIVLSKVICQGEEIEPMFAFGTPNVTWISLDGINPPVFQGPKYVFSSQQTSLDTGSYRFQVYDINEETGCYSDTVEVSLTLAPGAETNLFGKDSVCVNTTDSYYTKYNSTSTYNWRLTGNHLNYSKDASSTSVRYVDWVAPGIDTLIVYEQTWAGCEGWDTLVIKVAPYPEPHFTWSMPGSANVIELQDSTIQDSLVSIIDGVEVKENIPYTMYWNYGHFDGDPNAIDKEVPYEQRNFPIREGSYLYGYNCPSLKVVNAFGCSNTTSECIFVNIASSLYIPSAFSPTNPAHSVRNFQPKGFNIEECKVSVYDRWGNLLWYSDEVKDGMFIGSWDGTYNGKIMKSDTYIWKIEAKFLDGQVWDGYDSGNGKKVKYGNVILVR